MNIISPNFLATGGAGRRNKQDNGMGKSYCREAVKGSVYPRRLFGRIPEWGGVTVVTFQFPSLEVWVYIATGKYSTM